MFIWCRPTKQPSLLSRARIKLAGPREGRGHLKAGARTKTPKAGWCKGKGVVRQAAVNASCAQRLGPSQTLQ